MNTLIRLSIDFDKYIDGLTVEDVSLVVDTIPIKDDTLWIVRNDVNWTVTVVKRHFCIGDINDNDQRLLRASNGFLDKSDCTVIIKGVAAPQQTSIKLKTASSNKDRFALFTTYDVGSNSHPDFMYDKQTKLWYKRQWDFHVIKYDLVPQGMVELK